MGPNLGDHTPGGAPALPFCKTNPAGGARSGARRVAGESDRRVPPSSPADTSCSMCRLYCCTPLLPHRVHTSTLRRDDRTPQSSLTDRWLRSAAVGGRRVVPRDADKRRLGDGRRHCTTGGRKSRTNDGSKSRQAAADGDTMAGTVGGRGEKTRVVHPLSKRISHSKGGKQ